MFGGKEVPDKYSFDESKTYFVKGSFQSYNYYRQMYFYGSMLLLHLNKTYGARDWKLTVNMIVVETINPYHAQVFRVSDKWMKLGKEEFLDLLEKAIYAKKYGYDKLPDMNELEAYLI